MEKDCTTILSPCQIRFLIDPDGSLPEFPITSQYALGNYTNAINRFETVLGFPESAKKPYAQLMIGNAYSALGNAAAARDAYNSVISTYPTSALVAKAQEKLARLR